jgi:hypothetical protein
MYIGQSGKECGGKSGVSTREAGSCSEPLEVIIQVRFA